MAIAKQLTRCSWCGSDQLYIKYHDEEWGVPLHDDRKLFELLTLEGAQAGLSWLTILKRRQGYRNVFLNFDVKVIARFNDQQIAKLLTDEAIIRNKLKILSVVSNAKAVLAITKEYGSFNDYLWHFIGNKPIIHHCRNIADLVSSNGVSLAMSKDLKKRGCNFVGPTICYAFMQASGMVNDHTTDCFRYKELVS